MVNNYIKVLEDMMKDLALYEKKGLDTSSLRLFIKSLKMFNRLNEIEQPKLNQNLNFNDKLNIIKSFLEDKKAFPRIKDVIIFANDNLELNFKDQKESREVTIKRVIGRIKETPELKEKVKQAVQTIRNKKVHTTSQASKKDAESTASFLKWAEILKNI